MSLFDINSLSYSLLPSKFRGSPNFLGLHNDIYKFWHSMFSQVLQARDREAAVEPDHFFRQNIIATVTYKNEVVGLHLYTFFNFRSLAARSNPYFSDFTQETWQYLAHNNLWNIMTMEYLSVNPKFGRSKTGISFGEIMVGLGFKVLENSSQDCTLGIARVDKNVDKMGQQFGGIPVQTGITRYDYECVLMLSTRQDAHAHPDAQTQALVNHLWAERQDYTSESSDYPLPMPMAA